MFTKGFFIKVGIWLTLFVLSYRINMQKIFVMVSIVYLMFSNLGTRKPGEKSAYSIFNDNFQKLPGTFSSEGIDNMLRGRVQDTKKTPSQDSDQTRECMEEIAQSYRKNKSKSGNMPCYCGSGRKYKKCCISTGESGQKLQ